MSTKILPYISNLECLILCDDIRAHSRLSLGGVDSSVSAGSFFSKAIKLKAYYMKNWEEDDGTEYCTAMEDLADAQAVCDKIGIKLHTANFAMEYSVERVI